MSASSVFVSRSLIQLVELYDATLLPHLGTLALHTSQVAVWLSVVLCIKLTAKLLLYYRLTHVDCLTMWRCLCDELIMSISDPIVTLDQDGPISTLNTTSRTHICGYIGSKIANMIFLKKRQHNSDCDSHRPFKCQLMFCCTF